jgi:glutamate-1-semialdehyde 2,1-aminomutase
MKNKGAKLWEKAKKIIPGGNQLLSKRSEMFLPNEWPAYYSKAKGCMVWDLDGNKYIDMSISGVATCTLGFADSSVDAAVIKAINSGNMATFNVPEEVKLAELLCEIHPWSQMVRFARTGGEAMAIAVRIVRAATGKEKILFCGYHGWHDWYLSANLAKSSALDGQLLPGLDPAGVPRGLRDTSIPFNYNDFDSFQSFVDKYDGQIAAVVMEPVRNYWPEKNFIGKIRQITRSKKIPLVFDEVTSGFRMITGGFHLKIGIEPDVAVFAKALGNGYPIAAIIGRREIMDAAQKTFISSTYWTDKIGPVAALATIKKHKKYNVSSHLVEIGNLMQKGFRELGKRFQIEIEVTGIPPLTHWQIKSEYSPLIHTILAKKMLEKKFLISKSFASTYAHSKEHVQKYFEALQDILKDIHPYIQEGTIETLREGPDIHSGFRRLN